MNPINYEFILKSQPRNSKENLIPDIMCCELVWLANNLCIDDNRQWFVSVSVCKSLSAHVRVCVYLSVYVCGYMYMTKWMTICSPIQQSTHRWPDNMYPLIRAAFSLTWQPVMFQQRKGRILSAALNVNGTHCEYVCMYACVCALSHPCRTHMHCYIDVVCIVSSMALFWKVSSLIESEIAVNSSWLHCLHPIVIKSAIFLWCSMLMEIMIIIAVRPI